MKERVQITVTGVHTRDGGHTEETKSEVRGRYRREKGAHVVEYEETMDVTDIVTFNRVRMTETGMEIVRRGSVDSELKFAAGRDDESMYKTPLGSMKMRIRTTRYNLYTMEKGNRLIAEAEYKVIMNGMEMSDTLIRLDIRPDEMTT